MGAFSCPRSYVCRRAGSTYPPLMSGPCLGWAVYILHRLHQDPQLAEQLQKNIKYIQLNSSYLLGKPKTNILLMAVLLRGGWGYTADY